MDKSNAENYEIALSMAEKREILDRFKRDESQEIMGRWESWECPLKVEEQAETLLDQLRGTEAPEDFNLQAPDKLVNAHKRHTFTNYDELLNELPHVITEFHAGQTQCRFFEILHELADNDCHELPDCYHWENAHLLLKWAAGDLARKI